MKVKKVNHQQSQTEVRGLPILPCIPKLSERVWVSYIFAWGKVILPPFG